MKRFTRLYSSLIGKKFIVAITGIAMLGFLVGHMTGNLKIFLGDLPDGQPDIDHYAHFLREMGVPMVPHGMLLWVARIGLLVSVILHVVTVIQLSLINKAARPQGYASSNYKASTLPARFMMISGLAVLGFIVFHILHFTTGSLPIAEFEHGQVFNNLYHSFKKPIIGMIYLVAMVLVAFHLLHGMWSLFQSLGLDNPDRNPILRAISTVLPILLVAGFCMVPLAFMIGMFETPSDYYLDSKSKESVQVEEKDPATVATNSKIASAEGSGN